MRQIIEHSHGHPLKNLKSLLPNEFSCVACWQGKLIVRPSFTKVIFESLVFLERIHRNISGPIHPPCGPIRYFMILIDASTRCHMFVSFLHIMLPFLDSFHKWSNYEHNSKVILLKQYVLIMLANLLLEHSLTIVYW